MRIVFTRTGGVGGQRLRGSLDGDALPEEEREELARLLADAGFWTGPADLAAPERAPDRFRYRLLVEDGARRREIRATEEAMPDPLRALVRWVEARATRAPAAGA
jgi:hypothetical protein